MYYLDYDVVVSAFNKLINQRTKKIDNGIVGLHFLMKNSTELDEVSGAKRISFDNNLVTHEINHIFSFHEKQNLAFNPSTFFILASNFEEQILQMLRSEKIDLPSLAVVLMQTEEFVEEISCETLVELFIQKFKLPSSYIDLCFETDNEDPLEIAFSNTLLNDQQRKEKLEELFENETENSTLDFNGKWLASDGGSFGAGAYTQKMKATSALKELIFVPSGNLQNSLGYSGEAPRATINPNSLNVLFFGPSGTGKSTEVRRELTVEKNVIGINITEVTFHPEYTYSDFVGSLKPNTLYKSSDGSIFDTAQSANSLYENKEPLIEFKFEAGPFITACINAANDDPSIPHALIIDEINRGNVPEILGDIFQLLDRDPNTKSNSNSELQKFLKSESSTDIFNEGLVIPPNLYIYATINPADQNVYPLDTAFKRRWKRRFWDINTSHEACENWELNICNKKVPWLQFIDILNKFITHDLDLSEDKQLGQFFIKLSERAEESEIRDETLKVISYLWEDIPKSKRKSIFSPTVKSFGDVFKLLFNENPLSVIFANTFVTSLEAIIENVTEEETTEADEE